MSEKLDLLQCKLEALTNGISAKATSSLIAAIRAIDKPLVVRIAPHIASTFRSLIGHPSSDEATVIAAIEGLKTLFQITAQAAALIFPNTSHQGDTEERNRKHAINTRLRSSPLNVPLHLGLLADVIYGKKLHVSVSEEIIIAALDGFTSIIENNPSLAQQISDQPVLLGYIMFVILKQIENREFQLNTRKQAMVALRCILVTGSKKPHSLAFALPGILSSMTNTVTKTAYVHTALAVAALDIITLLLTQLSLGTKCISTSTQEQQSGVNPVAALISQMNIFEQQNKLQSSCNIKQSTDAHHDETITDGGCASSSSPTSHAHNKDDRLSVTLDGLWWNKVALNTSTRVNLILDTLVSHQHSRVRLSCVFCVHALLMSCLKQLPGLLDPAVIILVTLLSDSEAHVSSAARDACVLLTLDASKSFKKSVNYQQNPSVDLESAAITSDKNDSEVGLQVSPEKQCTSKTPASAVDNGLGSYSSKITNLHTQQESKIRSAGIRHALLRVLHSTITSLPTMCRTSTDDELLTIMQRLCGCLTLLTKRDIVYLQGEDIPRHFIGAMKTLFTFDTQDFAVVVEDATAFTEAGASISNASHVKSSLKNSNIDARCNEHNFSFIRKVFKYYRSDKILNLARHACQLFANQGPCLQDAFTEILRCPLSHLHQHPSLMYLLIVLLRSSEARFASWQTLRRSSMKEVYDFPLSMCSPANIFYWDTVMCEYMSRARGEYSNDIFTPSSDNFGGLNGGCDERFSSEDSLSHIYNDNTKHDSNQQRSIDDCHAHDILPTKPNRSVSRSNDDYVYSAAQRLYTLCMQSYWHNLCLAPTTDEENSGASISVAEIRQNIISVCIALEGIATSAQVLHHDFSRRLPETLYCLLTHASSSCIVVHRAAIAALENIAVASGCSSRQELVSVAANSLIGRFCGFLRCPDLHPEAPIALHALLEFAPSSTFPVIRNACHSIFLGLDGYHDSQLSLSYLKLLYQSVCDNIRQLRSAHVQHSRLIVQAILRWQSDLDKLFAAEQQQHISHEMSAQASVKNETEDMKTYNRVISGIASLGSDPSTEDLNKLKSEIGPDFDKLMNEAEDAINDSPSNVADDEDSIPSYVALTVEITERVLHFMGDVHPKNRQKCLMVLDKCFRTLRSHSRQLLPLVHKSWLPLLHRMEDSVLYVRQAAISLLPVIVDVSGDFVLRRMISDVLPRVISVLDDQIKAVEGQSFRFHSSIRLTVTALNVIGSLWSELDGGFQIRPIIRASISFLRNDLPVEIQNAAKETVARLSKQNPDIVWFGLIAKWRRDKDQTYFQACNISDSFFPEPDVRFAENISHLLAGLDNMETE